MRGGARNLTISPTVGTYVGDYIRGRAGYVARCTSGAPPRQPSQGRRRWCPPLLPPRRVGAAAGAARGASGERSAGAARRQQVGRVQRGPRAAARQQPPRDAVDALLLRLAPARTLRQHE